MARRWNALEEDHFCKELQDLYVRQNKSLREVAAELQIAEQSVFQRLQRLGIPIIRHLKKGYNNKRAKTVIPLKRSNELAELFGVLLGDGHVAHFQVLVTLGSKEIEYVQYVRELLKSIFKGEPGISIRATGHRTVYLGSVDATRWLIKEGLVPNKVRSQVGVPKWIFGEKAYMEHFLRGFFDTDGSVYKLRYGIQVSLCNKSRPLLDSLQMMLRRLGYSPSAVSAYKIYLTRSQDVRRFFREIQPANMKHRRRYEEFVRRVGIQAVNGDAL